MIIVINSEKWMIIVIVIIVIMIKIYFPFLRFENDVNCKRNSVWNVDSQEMFQLKILVRFSIKTISRGCLKLIKRSHWKIFVWADVHILISFELIEVSLTIISVIHQSMTCMHTCWWLIDSFVIEGNPGEIVPGGEPFVNWSVAYPPGIGLDIANVQNVDSIVAHSS